MSQIDGFGFALNAALGKREAAHFKIRAFDEEHEIALAYNESANQMLMLFVDRATFHPLSGDAFLDYAKQINARFQCFSVPDQKIPAQVLWGGKDGRCIHVYKFRVINHPLLF